MTVVRRKLSIVSADTVERCRLGFHIFAFAGVKGENYIENTINVHRFSFIAKKSLHTLKVR